MSYARSGGSGTISGSSDAALSNPADGEVLTYNAGTQKWRNTTAPAQQVASGTAAGAVKLTGDLGGTSASPTVPGLANKLDITTAASTYAPKANPTFTGVVTLPSTTPTAATQAATKGYVDSVAGSGASNATTTAPGLVQLAGDLGGTATAPTLSATTNVNSIISGNSTVNGNSTAIAGKAAKGANSDITSLAGLTTALSIGQGGTGATTASAAVTALGAIPTTQKAAASGVASLDGSTLVPRAQLGTGTASNSTVLYGDGVWRAASAGSGGYTWTATKTANYTAANGDAVIGDASAGGFTVTLPTNLGANALVRVKKVDATVNAILVSSSALIDNSASFSLNNQYASQDFSYTGSTWYAV